MILPCVGDCGRSRRNQCHHSVPIDGKSLLVTLVLCDGRNPPATFDPCGSNNTRLRISTVVLCSIPRVRNAYVKSHTHTIPSLRINHRYSLVSMTPTRVILALLVVKKSRQTLRVVCSLLTADGPFAIKVCTAGVQRGIMPGEYSAWTRTGCALSHLPKRYGEEIGAPGEDPTTAVMRGSNAAAMSDCLPLREWPVIATWS